MNSNSYKSSERIESKASQLRMPTSQNVISPYNNALGTSTSLFMTKSSSSKNLASSSAGFTNGMFATQPSQFYSSSTLRHSSSVISFPRSERFYTQKSASECGAKYDMKSSLSSKTTTLGYGEKRVFS